MTGVRCIAQYFMNHTEYAAVSCLSIGRRFILVASSRRHLLQVSKFGLFS